MASINGTNDYKSTRKEDIASRILHEPVIANNGEYANGLLLIRNGFAPP